MADGIASAAEAGLFDARRACGGPIAAAGNHRKVPVEGGGGKIFGHGGVLMLTGDLS
jgi:hypothetical protein